MSLISGIYWVDLGFINNYKESQLRLVFLRYSADVASAFPYLITLRAGMTITNLPLLVHSIDLSSLQ